MHAEVILRGVPIPIGHGNDDTAGHEPPVSGAALADAPRRARFAGAVARGHSRCHRGRAQPRVRVSHGHPPCLHALSAPPGRPAAGDAEREHAVRADLLEFLLPDPGAAHPRRAPPVRAERWRFARALHARRPTLSVAALARATRISAATLTARCFASYRRSLRVLLCVIASDLPCQLARAGSRCPPFLGLLATVSVRQRQCAHPPKSIMKTWSSSSVHYGATPRA
ncbi:MAG TPA: hypothetical protein VNM90_17225 [Haliangium sp.]|nr:hypothetical protein [Haliangium sp.]